MDIKGQVAVITDAGSGIGQAVAVSLAKRGVKALGLVDRNESVRTVAEMINEENGDGKKIASPSSVTPPTKFSRSRPSTG